MSNMLQRAITGFFFLVIMIGGILGGVVPQLLLFLFIQTLCLVEYYSIIQKWSKPYTLLGLASGIGVYSTLALSAHGYIPTSWSIVIIALPAIMGIRSIYQAKEHTFSDLLFTLGGPTLISIPFGLLVATGASHEAGSSHTILILGFFLIIWVTDTFAYLTGKWIGKNPLAPHISAGKTIEGTVGGILFGMATAVILNYTIGIFSLSGWIIFGALTAVTAVHSDLIESRLKRQAGVKDSGTLLPGHGGFLDRFDSVLLSAPIIYIFKLIYFHL